VLTSYGKSQGEHSFHDRALKHSACILPWAQLRDAKTERNGLRNYFLIG